MAARCRSTFLTQPAVNLPHNWRARPYQDSLWRALAHERKKRAVAIWHRRSGKDDIGLHWSATAACERIGNYWHMLPKANQARRAIWEAVNPHSGLRRIDEAFPKEIRANTREQEMMIRFKNGSTWQVVGSDSYSGLIGAPPVGIVFSEYSLADPAAWDYLRPILVENGGWALFIYTPRGKNHGYTMYRMAKRNPEWFAELLTIVDTGALSLAAIESERQAGMSEDMIQQEFFCSFEAANPGSYYGKQMSVAWKEGRIGSVPIEPGIECETFWDLGIGDTTAIWIAQFVGRELRIVGYYETNGEGLAHYANWLKTWAETRDVRFSRHVMPHDIEVRELGSGKSRKQVALGLGLAPIFVAPNLPIEDGIEAVRRLLARCWFDERATDKGVSALTEYCKEWDDKNNTFKDRPKHDWASNGADAFRMLAVTVKDRAFSPPPPQAVMTREPWQFPR